MRILNLDSELHAGQNKIFFFFSFPDSQGLESEKKKKSIYINKS